MKAFLAGLIVAVLLSGATAFVLLSLDRGSGELYSSPNVRLGE